MSNHCVPEWEPTERDLAFNIFDSEDYPYQSKSKTWDLGPSKKQDIAFVPDDDFEELCWEDGQLLVVMQGQGHRSGAKGNSVHSNEATYRVSPSRLTSCKEDVSQSCITRGSISVHEPPASCTNFTQDDDLLSWLQHPQDDNFYSKNSDAACIPTSSTFKECDSAREHEYAQGDSVSAVVSLCNPFSLNNGRLDAALGCIPKQKCMLGKGKNVQVDDYVASNNVHSSTIGTVCDATRGSFCVQEAMPEENMGSNALDVDDGTWTDASKIEPFSTRNGFKGHLLEQGKTTMCSLHTTGQTHDEPGCACFMDTTRARDMNFANFARPATAIKANLHTVGIASGPTGVIRLKQKDRNGFHPFTSEFNKLPADFDRSITPVREEYSGSRSAGASCTPLCEENVSSLLGKQKNYGSHFASSDVSASTDLRAPTDVSYTKPTVTCSSVENSYQSYRMKELQNENVYDSKAEDVKNSKPSIFKETCSGSAHQTKNSTITSGKRNRTAEKHNLSERKRRSKIKEKMIALQDLIPNVNKNDKASMLEEAINYLKSLQQKVQVMAFRGGMNRQWTGQFPLQIQCPGSVALSRMPYMGMGIGMQEMLDVIPKVATPPVIQGAPMPSPPLHGMMMPPIVGPPFLPPTFMTAPIAGVVHQGLTHPAYQMFLPVQPMMLPDAMHPFCKYQR